jgi:hypothetical protein
VTGAPAATESPSEPATTAQPTPAPAVPDPPSAAAAAPAQGGSAPPPPTVDSRESDAPSQAAERAQPLNRASASGRLRRAPKFSFHDGRITVGDARLVRCESDCPDPATTVDYEVEDLEIRAQPDEKPVLVARRARSRGSGSNRRTEVDVSLRRDDGTMVDGTIVLRRGEDLLDPSVYAGSGLEEAFAEVLAALRDAMAPGGPLDDLVVTFGDGRAVGSEVTTVRATVAERSRSGRVSDLVVDEIRIPVRRSGEDGALVQAGPPRQRHHLRHRGHADEPTVEGIGDIGAGVVQAGTTVAHELVAGACESFGGEGCRAESRPPFRVVLLTAVLLLDDTGNGEVTVTCPSGYEGVRGTLEIVTAIREGRRQRALVDPVTFDCAAGSRSVEYTVQDWVLRELRDEDQVSVMVRVRIVDESGARFAVATVDALPLLLRRNADERP